MKKNKVMCMIFVRCKMWLKCHPLSKKTKIPEFTFPKCVFVGGFSLCSCYQLRQIYIEIQWLKQGSMTPCVRILVFSSLLIWIQFLSLGVTYNYSNSPIQVFQDRLYVYSCCCDELSLSTYVPCNCVLPATRETPWRKDAFEPLGKKHDYQVLSYLSLWFLASIN